MTRWLDFLLHGSDEMTLPQSWLANRERIRAYDHWTRRQRFQGSITADVDEMRRRAFWEAVAAKREQRAVIRQFGRKQATS